MGKNRMLILTLGGAVLAVAALSVVWSIVPFGGDTLPQRVAEGAGMPFKLSALLVSLVSAVLGVVGMFILSFYPITAPND